MSSGNETNGYSGNDIRPREGRSYPPVYHQTWSYAVEHGELEEYRASQKLDRECKATLEETIRQNFDGMHLNHDIVRPLAEQYGLERMTFILANTIRQASWDGRFSRDNKSWASKFSIDEDIVNGTDRNRYLTIGIHPTVLDGFISMFRREIPELEKENRRDVRSMQAASISSVPGYVVMSQFDRTGQISGETVYLGLSENYRQDAGIYDNSDNSLVFVSDNPKMFSFLDSGKGWTSSQQEMIDNGVFTAEDYAEYYRIMREILSAYPDARIKHFSIDIDREGSGIPFSPDWQPERQRSIMRRDWDAEHIQSSAVEDFKAKTNEQFHRINEMNPAEIEETAVPPENLKKFVKDYYGGYGDIVCTKKIAEALSVSIRKMIDTHQMENTRGAIEAVLDKDSTYEFMKSRQPNISPVPAEVIQAVDEYFEKAPGLGNFTPVKICRISNDPSDHYLYAAVGYHLKTEEYACWTSWNHSIASLNMGHYNLPDEQAALDIIRDRFNDISDEPGKYGMDCTLTSIEQPEIGNLQQQPENKQEQAGKIVHFNGKRGR